MSDDFGIIFWVHVILIVLGFLTPFLFNFWLVLFGMGVIYVQWALLDGCFLTKKQFCKEEEETTFYKYYLTKAGFPVDDKTSNLIAEKIIPLGVIFLSIFLQAFLQLEPLIF